MNTPRALLALLRRDLGIAVQRTGELGLPLVFFLLVATLFPLGLSPERELLVTIGPGVLWVAALLASLLALDMMFRADLDDGSLEQLVMSPPPLALLVVVAQAYYLPAGAARALLWTLLLATPTLSLIGGVAAALTAGLRRGTGLLGLLVLPLALPLLVFGARGTELAAAGEPIAGPLYLLGAMLVLALTLTPWAMAAALRITLD